MKKHSKYLKLLCFAFLVAAITVIMMTTVSAEVVASGSFADNATVNADKCTWTYSLDSNGTLTIGGTGTGTTDLNYNKGYNDLANNNYSQIPWKNSGKIGTVEIKKVIIEESTGITSFGTYALGYLKFMEEIVIPSTVTSIGTSCFSTAERLKTIRVHGNDDLGEGCWDFRNIKSIKSHAFAGATHKKYVPNGIDVYFSEKLASLPSATDSWNWFRFFGKDTSTSPDANMTVRVTFNIVQGSYADTVLTAYVERQKTYDATAEAPDTTKIDKSSTTNVELAYYVANGNCKEDLSGYNWTLDKLSGVLTISGTSDSTTLGFTNPANWNKLTNIPWYDHRSSIKKVVIEEDTGITAIQQYVLSNLPKCTTIILPKTCVDLSSYNIFASCLNLSSIAYCGEDVIDGIIDISLATKINSQLFESSSANKTLTVIIGKPQSLSVSKWFNPTTTVNFKTYEDSLAVDIFNQFGTASDPRVADFKFNVGNLSYIYDIKGAIKMEGFGIRFKDYNGLRGIFSFNESESAKYTSSGYTLLEYGTIIASSASRASYGTALTFNESANAFETANAKVVKAAVYQDASLSKNSVSGYVGKILGKFSDEESGDQLVRYAVSVVNYKDNFMSDVYMTAYSIYCDDTSGQLYITYADYSDNHSDYAETSIYDLTLGMYKTGFCNAEDDPDGVLWGVLEACAVTLKEGTHYRAGDYDMNGEPFGATYTYKNVPVYKSSHDKNTVLTKVNYSNKDYPVYPITFTAVQDLTLTLLPDGESYVMVYRSTAGDDKKVELPANSEWGSPPAFAQFRARFNSYRRENTKPGIAPLLYDISGSTPVAVGYINSSGTEVYNDGFSGTGYRCQPAPTFIESAVTNKVTTVILDHGISAVNANSLSYLKYMKTFIYPKTFTTIDNEGFQRANSITTIAEKGGIYKEGFLDFGGVETLLNTRQFIIDTNTTANATELRLPNVTKLPTEFIMRMTNLTTVWMGDISNRVEGFANLTGIKSIGSGMFNGCTSLTKYYLDDNVTLASTSNYVGAVAGTQIFTQNKNDSVAANTYVTSGNAVYRFGYTINQALSYPDLSAIADVRSFDTNINSSLLLITNVENEASLEALLGENAPQVAIMDVDTSAYESSGEIFDLNIVGSNGEVIITALDTVEKYTQNKIIPAFRAESTAEAESVARFMTYTAMNDLMLIAPDMSMIEAARAINKKVNGVLDCTGTGYTFDAEGLRAIKDTVKTAGLNICILPSSAATQDNVEYLTDRFVQTWFDDDDSADETVELFKLINAGAFGVVTQNTAKFIEIVESDIFALNSRTRVTKINNHNCYNRNNALGNEIATAKNAIEVYGVQSVELDINMTADKVLIVHHNRSDTINGTKYNYADMTYDEIKAVSGLQGIGQISLYFDYMLANRDVYDMIFRIEIKSSGHTTDEQAEALEVLVSEIGKYTDEEQAYILEHLQMVSFSATVCQNARSSLPTVQQSFLYMAHKTVSEVLNAMLTSGYHQNLYYNAGHIDDLSLSKEDYMTLLIRGNLSGEYGSKANSPGAATLFMDNKAYIGLDGSANQIAANLPARLISGASSYNISVGGAVEAEIKQFTCADLVKYGSEGTAVTSATMHVINGDASGVTFDGTSINGLSAGTYTVVFRYSFEAYNTTAHIYTMPVTITVG